MKKKAIIIGATGLVGNKLLELLLESNTYEKVTVFTRKPTGVNHNKLHENLCNPLVLEEQKNKFYADEVYCCIGTTKNKTPNKDTYRKIDAGIPTTIAKLCEENKIKTLVVISAIGAKKESSFFYNKIKGEMEELVLSHKIPNITIIRPSLIYGDRKEKRIAENVSVFFMKIFQVILITKLKKYRCIRGKNLAIVLHKCSILKGHNIIFQDHFKK